MTTPVTMMASHANAAWMGPVDRLAQVLEGAAHLVAVGPPGVRHAPLTLISVQGTLIIG